MARIVTIIAGVESCMIIFLALLFVVQVLCMER